MKNQIRMLLAAMLMTPICAAPVMADNSAITEMQQNSHPVKGIVKDAVGPMAGVNVLIKGTTTGMMTNPDGSYNLPNVPAGAILEFSFMGYQTVEVTVGSSETVNVTLKEDQNLLDELVVIGYGTVKKSDVTGAVASVGAEAIEKASTGDALQAIQGRATGVQIVTSGGSPDAVAEIKIRGTGSPNGSTPLFVVDGFPMSDINYLSPNDIASIEILKDASACAIYGSRGANGVVMVTTKQAKSGKLKLNVKSEFGLEATPEKPEMLNSVEYAEFTNLARSNSGLAPKYDNPSSITTNTNWFNEVMRTGKYQNHSITLSGGTDNVSTVFTTNLFSREGTVKSTAFQRLNFSQKTQYKPFERLTLNASFSGSFMKSNSLGATSSNRGNGANNRTIFLSSLIAPPDVPVWDDVTNYYSGITAFRLANPAGVIARNNGKNNNNVLMMNLSADLKLTKDLVFTSRFGYRYGINLNSDFIPIYTETSNITSGNTEVSRTTSFDKDWTWENMLTFNKKFGVHEISIMGAMSARDYYYESYYGNKKNLPSEAEQFHYFDAAADPNPTLTGSAVAQGMLSYLGRINYNLLDRYLFTASFRADGSSRFVGSKKWGYFPSGAFAWKVSEEPFFKSIAPDWFSTAKFRLGWGQIGNERISSYYPYQTAISQNQYYVLGNKERVNGVLLSRLGNKDLQWETSEQYNAGIDLGFLASRLTATVDIYLRKTNDILLNETVPRVSGTNSIVRNVGGIQNKGLELAIGWKDDIGDFSYSIDANASFNKNTVTNLGTSGILQANGLYYDYALIDFQGQFNNIICSTVGNPYGRFYGYEMLGIFQNQQEIDNYKSSDGTVIMPNAKPGDSIFADTNDDGKINSKDMVVIGDPNPVAVYGLSLNANWKGFDLSVLFQGTWGNDIFNASKFYFEKFDGRQNVLKTAYKAGWSGEGSTNSTPITLAYDSDDARNSQNWWQSTMYVEDGSYIRLKNIQLGYTFSPKISTKTQPSFRVYLSAQNLLTLTGYSGFDPEIFGNGVDAGQYPQPRTFVLGININL